MWYTFLTYGIVNLFPGMDKSSAKAIPVVNTPLESNKDAQEI